VSIAPDPDHFQLAQDYQEACTRTSRARPQLLVVEISRILALDRCGGIDLGEEIRYSPKATYIDRAAAEAPAQARQLPSTSPWELKPDDLRAWLGHLQTRSTGAPDGNNRWIALKCLSSDAPSNVTTH